MPRFLEEKIQEFAIRSTQARVKKNNDRIVSELKSEFADYKKAYTFEVPSMEGKKQAIFHPSVNSLQYVFDSTGKFSCYDSEAKKLTNFSDLGLGSDMTCSCVNQALSNENSISLSFGASNGTFLIKNFNSAESTSTVQYKNSDSSQGLISIEQHPVKTLLLTLSEERYFKIFDLNSERFLFKKQFEDDLDLRSLKVHPDGRLAALGGTAGNVHLWDLKANSLSTSFQTEKQNTIDILQFSDNGYTVACGSTWSENFEIFDLRNCSQYLHKIETSEELTQIEFSKSGRTC